MSGIERGVGIMPSDAHLASEFARQMWRDATTLVNPGTSVSMGDVATLMLARKRADDRELARQQEQEKREAAAAEAERVAAERFALEQDAAETRAVFMGAGTTHIKVCLGVVHLCSD